MFRQIYLLNIGRLPYSNSLKLQEHCVTLMKSNLFQDVIHGILIIVEHSPVYTIGIQTRNYNFEIKQKLIAVGAEFYETNRGGQITFHGPGQLVAYPILNLKYFHPSVRWYVSQLEKTVILTCDKYNIMADTSAHTGVWVNDKKICAIGLRISKYITSHGIGLNCNTDLNWFSHIIPCGIKDKGVTSLTEECKKNVSIEETSPYFLESFEQQFECEIIKYPIELINNTMKSILQT